MLVVGLLVPLVAFGNEAEAQTAEREVPTFVVPVDSSNPHVFEVGDRFPHISEDYVITLKAFPSFSNGVCIEEFFLAFDGAVRPDGVSGIGARVVFDDNFSKTVTLGGSSYERVGCNSWQIGRFFELSFTYNEQPDCFASTIASKLEAEDTVHLTIEIFENDVLVARIITQEVTISPIYGVFGSIDFSTESEFGATARICNPWGISGRGIGGGFRNLRFENRNLTDTEFTYETDGGLYSSRSLILNLSEAFVATLAPGTHMFEAEFEYFARDENGFFLRDDNGVLRTETTTVELSLYIPTPDDGQNQGSGNQNQGGGNQNQGSGNQNQGGGNQNQGGGNQNQGGGNQNQNNPYKTPPTGQSAVATVGIVTMFVAIGIIGVWTYKKKAVV